jgi:hypothetical protein
MPALPYWLFPGDDRPTEEIDDEIAEELQLHLDLLAEEQERRGLAPEEAKQKAAERFGDFNQLLRRCRREKQGDVPMLKRIQAVLIGLLAIGVAVIGIELWTTSSITKQYMIQNNMMLSTLEGLLASLQKQSLVEKSQNKVMIRVTDENDKPIEGVTLTFGWTNAQRNFFDSYTVSPNERGEHETELRFRDKELDSVTAYAPGYAFVTESLNRPFPPGGGRLTLKLPKAVKQRLKLIAPPDEVHSEARALSNAAVVLQSRFSDDRQSGLAQWLRLREQKTDANGVVELDYFAPGDSISLIVNESRTTWNAPSITIDPNQDPLEFELDPGTNYRGGMGNGGGMF